jgi:hypothetical protein
MGGGNGAASRFAFSGNGLPWRGYWAEANSDMQEISGVPWDETTEQGAASGV